MSLKKFQENCPSRLDKLLFDLSQDENNFTVYKDTETGSMLTTAVSTELFKNEECLTEKGVEKYMRNHGWDKTDSLYILRDWSEWKKLVARVENPCMDPLYFYREHFQVALKENLYYNDLHELYNYLREFFPGMELTVWKEGLGFRVGEQNLYALITPDVEVKIWEANGQFPENLTVREGGEFIYFKAKTKFTLYMFSGAQVLQRPKFLGALMTFGFKVTCNGKTYDARADFTSFKRPSAQ